MADCRAWRTGLEKAPERVWRLRVLKSGKTPPGDTGTEQSGVVAADIPQIVFGKRACHGMMIDAGSPEKPFSSLVLSIAKFMKKLLSISVGQAKEAVKKKRTGLIASCPDFKSPGVENTNFRNNLTSDCECVLKYCFTLLRQFLPISKKAQQEQ